MSQKKLIEVALPLEAINRESAREKSIRHGHPSTMHLWWARRPLAACRAILFASLVDDPSSYPERFPTEALQNQERQRLFEILGIIDTSEGKNNSKQAVRGLVSWDDVKDPKVVEAAQLEIAKCLAWARGEEPPTKPREVKQYIIDHAPAVYDPFAGGGSIPLEAQRLGLRACASDLNPVAVLITKALIEIPAKFAGQPPVNPQYRSSHSTKKALSKETWHLAKGLAEDVRYYGEWMREQALGRIGELYPSVKLPQGSQATVIAWIWARTVKCPNPACGCQMPLVKSFALSTRKGKEHWVKPIVNHTQTPPQISYEAVASKEKPPEGTVSRKGGRCIACENPVVLEYVRTEGRAGRMGAQLIAIVAEGNKARLYVSPDKEHEKVAASAEPKWKPETELIPNSRHVTPYIYGMTHHADLFTARQLMALTTFSDLVEEARVQLVEDGAAQEYADAVSTYLAFAVDKGADYWSSLSSWTTSAEKMRNTFGRQAIPMVWDFAECCPFSHSTGNWSACITWVYKVISGLPASVPADVWQMDARDIGGKGLKRIVIPTDPPYYDAVPYADLSDFFYVWLRKSIGPVYPELFRTLLTPKEQELVADPFRHGSREEAKQYFEKGLKEVFTEICKITHPEYPFTVQYAFKQTESDESEGATTNTASTGWETMLEALVQSGFRITGTLPIRTERSNRMRGIASNALSSSIALVCRPRPEDAPKATRRQFLAEIKQELPLALKLLQQGNIAPVDLAQASIGPGMAVFSKYSTVLESDGSPMQVRTALKLINQILDEYLTEQEGEFDGDTRWALTWFEQYQFNEGQYGVAETLSKAKNTSIQGLVEAGILKAQSGKVRLLSRADLEEDWNPSADSRLPDWEATQYLIRALDQQGEMGGAKLLVQLNGQGEAARDLAYRLYSLCDRKGWTKEALAYNSLVIAWPEISRLASQMKSAAQHRQTELEV